MDTRLKDKVCLITGASGGIGREITRLFHDEGALLVLFTSDLNELCELSLRCAEVLCADEGEGSLEAHLIAVRDELIGLMISLQ